MYQPQSANIFLRGGLGGGMAEERLENAAPAKLLLHIDALQPPKIPVAPVAPLIRDEDLAKDRALVFGHKIDAPGGIAQNRLHPRSHDRRIQPEILGLQRQRDVERGDHVAVSKPGLADDKFDARSVTGHPTGRKSQIEGRAEMKSAKCKMENSTLFRPPATLGPEPERFRR